MRGILLTFLLVAFLAGCGTTRTVTRTVQVKPCATAGAMSECVRIYAQRYQDEIGSGLTAHVKCGKPNGVEFDCTVLLAGAQSLCVDFGVERLSYGTPYPAETTQIDPAKCDATFGKS